MSNNGWTAPATTREPDRAPPSRYVEPVVAGHGPEVRLQSDDAEGCRVCGADVSLINIAVDGNMLVMESCDGCDTRRWHLAGSPITLDEALDEVGEHATRRR